ncbi:MAG: hypothetical protein R3213_07610 [Flavobacteriaceae bacterium]|nr:hypothetical protein [Flavobacteriaceae bacterium]
MNLKKVYYTKTNIVTLAIPFVIEIEGTEPFLVEIPYKNLESLQEDPPKHLIQDLLFEDVKKTLTDGKFFLIPSRHETEFEAYLSARLHHPENFPVDSDESIGGFGMSDLD